MRGRGWLLIGIAVGVAVALGDLPFLAGAGRTLTETAERVVASGGHHLDSALAAHGAGRRTVSGLAALGAVLLPGATALLLIVAARSTLRLRVVVGLLVVILGVFSFAYHPHGVAVGALALALAVAGAAVALSGPLVVAPLGALAGLIGAELVLHVAESSPSVSESTVQTLYQAVVGHPGHPAWFRGVVTVVALVPLALGAWLAIHD